MHAIVLFTLICEKFSRTQSTIIIHLQVQTLHREATTLFTVTNSSIVNYLH